MSLDTSKIKALISLLEDEDRLIWESAFEELSKTDYSKIDELNEIALEQDIVDDNYNTRYQLVIKKIRYNHIKKLFLDWKNNHQDNLLKAITYTCFIKYEGITEEELNQQIEKLRLDAWLEFHYDLTSFEKVKIINYILFQLHGFKGNESDFLNPNNSFINKVIEEKTGNPISLSILYLLVAQRLKLPIYGVNLPNHFILTYTDIEGDSTTDNFKNIGNQSEPIGKPLFYINAFNGGGVFNHEQLLHIIKKMNLEPKSEYLLPCNNYQIILRVLKNISNAYRFHKNEDYKLMDELIEAFEN